MPQVQVDPFGVIDFPDSMSHDDIVSAIKKGQSEWKLPALPAKDVMHFATGDRHVPQVGEGQPFAMRPLISGPTMANPQTVPQGIVNSLAKGLGGVMSPVGLATAPLMAAKPLQPLVFGLMAGMGAKSVGQTAGEIAGTPQATPGQRAEQVGDLAQAAAMTLPALAHGLPFVPPAKPENLPASKASATSPIKPVVQEKPVVQKPTLLEPVSPATTGPSFFEKGKVMAPPLSPETSAAYKESLKKLGSDELAFNYSLHQETAKQHLQRGNLEAANQEIVKGQFAREELQSRPVTFKPAVQVNGQIIEGQHNAASQQAYMAAQQQGIAVPKVERGAVGSDGKFYSLTEVARKQMEQSSVKQPTTKETNESRQVEKPQAAVQETHGNEQVPPPGNAGGLAQGARRGDKQGDEGRVLEGKPSAVQSLNKTEQAEEQTRLRKALGGEGGFVIIPKPTWTRLGFQGGTKVDPVQMFNRVRNVLGEGSETFRWLQSAGLQQFLSQPRSKEDLQKWTQENSPKVEVRKFGVGSLSRAEQKYGNTIHEMETLGYRHTGDGILEDRNGKVLGLKSEMEGDPNASMMIAVPKEHEAAFERFRNAGEEYDKHSDTDPEQSHWQFIAPKSESDMPGYVEIAVVKPVSSHAATQRAVEQGSHSDKVQFPSSHNFPPNTLGFVRGYMEKDTKTGEKTFHVIEVQSDWAQHLRNLQSPESDYGPNMVSVNRRLAILNASDPLLPHYERLSLKAAIEHARQEGATWIAVSDAETAMMTEGHDRGYDGPGNLEDQGFGVDARGNPIKEPTQTVGMRLHYDRTLPKILEELTGGEGKRADFGEHRMAMEDPVNAQAYTPNERSQMMRKDLIFHDPTGKPKTSVTARSFPIGKKNPEPEFSFFGKDKGEAGFIIQPGGQDILDLLDHPFVKEMLNKIRGVSLPRTSAINKKVADRLYLYGNAPAISDVLSKTDPTEVLGPDHYRDEAFDVKLGKTLVEYNVRATGNTTIGKPWSFKDDAEYQAALKDPEVLAAIQRHADVVLKPAEARHQALGGKLVELPDPRMYVNLKYLPKDEILSVQAKGLKATLQKKTRFSQERKGTAEQYETSYRKIAERMIKANWNEDARRQLNDEYVKQKLGQYVGPGDKAPAGWKEVPLRLQRAVIIPEGESPSVVSQNKSLYIRPDLYGEYMQAMNAAQHVDLGRLRKVADVLTKVQVSLGVDAIQHSVNIASAVDGAIRPELGKNIVGVKELDTIGKIAKTAMDAVKDDYAFQSIVGDMARNYGVARESSSYQGLFGGKSYGGEAIRIVDQAGRVTLFNIAKQLAKEGFIKDEPEQIRRFVNTQLGQYNHRLMSSFQAVMKSSLSPFIVAGKTFNRLGASRLLLSPQVKAANPKAWATMRARQALYVASALVIVPAIVNYAINGTATPPDTRFGQIKLPNGETFDMAKWTLLRRGLRITGAQAALEGQVMPRLRGEQPEAVGQTARQAFTDVARGIAAPYAGPVPNAAATLLTGKTALGYEARQPGESYPYLAAAGRQLNPALGAGLTDQPGQAGLQRLKSIIGIGDTKESTVINRLANQFNYKLGKQSEGDYIPSVYRPITDALNKGDVEEAKKAYSKLLAQKVEEHKQAGVEESKAEGEAKLELQKYYERYAKREATGSKEREKAFVESLSPHQLDLYKAMQEQQQKASQLFFNEIQHKTRKSKVGSLSF